MKFKFVWTASLAALILACPTATMALDLPIKQINGKRYYVYITKKGDTVYGVANNLGVTRNDIITHNSSAADGLTPRMALYFPVDEFEDVNPANPRVQGNVAVDGVITADFKNTQATDTVRYVVKKGDTLFGIAHEFGVSADAIAENNPGTATGVKTGQVLYIPVTVNTVSSKEAPGADALRQVNPQKSVINIAESTILEQPEENLTMPAETAEPDTAVVSETIPQKEFNIAIMLPFMLNDEKPGKPAQLATDFYKGFLIAADTMEMSMPQVNIIAIDTEGNTDRVEQLLNNDSRLRNADIIIAPDNAAQLSYLSNFSRRNNVYVFNSMNAHDTTYMFSPYMIQASIPSERMINKAVQACINDNVGFTPVIMLNDASRNDKKNFVDALVSEYTAKAIVPNSVSFSNSLTLSELIDQLGEPDMNTRLVFIPSSGSLAEFNRFSSAIEKYRNKAIEAGGDVRVFGYPEWTAFRGDTRTALHNINAKVYTRSFSDPNSLATSGVNNSFVKWFGHEMTDGVPAQGLLGYDTGCFILKGLVRGAFLDNNIDLADMQGSQSTFNLRRANENQGPVNDALYIVHFLPGEVIDIDIK